MLVEDRGETSTWNNTPALALSFKISATHASMRVLQHRLLALTFFHCASTKGVLGRFRECTSKEWPLLIWRTSPLKSFYLPSFRGSLEDQNPAASVEHKKNGQAELRSAHSVASVDTTDERAQKITPK